MCTYKSCQIGSSWMELQVQRNFHSASPYPLFPPLSPLPPPPLQCWVGLAVRPTLKRGEGRGGVEREEREGRDWKGILLNNWLWNVSKHGTTHIGLLQCLHIIQVCLLLNFVLHTTQFRLVRGFFQAYRSEVRMAVQCPVEDELWKVCQGGICLQLGCWRGAKIEGLPWIYCEPWSTNTGDFAGRRTWTNACCIEVFCWCPWIEGGVQSLGWLAVSADKVWAA